MRIDVVPCLRDNYAYLLVCERTKEFAVVDASEDDAVLRVALPKISHEGLKPVAILSTHHHLDHVGGNEELAPLWSVPVYGGEKDKGRIPALTNPLTGGDTFTIGEIRVRVMHVPGHTLGAIAYVCEDDHGPPCVFTGDTMFVAGSGRLFEGTPEMMYDSLTRLCALPPETRVYCGHEYTLTNLRFAKTIDPKNEAIDARIVWAEALREKGEPTMPSTIADERATNPFVRSDDASELARVRTKKDSFNG